MTDFGDTGSPKSSPAPAAAWWIEASGLRSTAAAVPRAARAASDGVVTGFDGLDGIFERLFQHAFADGPEHEAEHPPLQILALAHHDHVDVGHAAGLARERIGVAGGASPHIRIRRREHDAVGIGPVVIQTLPDAARALGDVGPGRTAAVHLEIIVGAVAKKF